MGSHTASFNRRVSLSPRLLASLCPCVLVLFSSAAAFAGAQPPPKIPPPPDAPVVGLHIVAPPDVQATVCPDGCRFLSLATPATISVRPGYIYRFRLSNLPQGKDVAIYPTVEVIGTLKLPSYLDPGKFPVPIVITADDIDRVLTGAFITKVYVLENPDHAAPVATQADRPLETVVDPHRNLLEEAWTIGRPMVVLRLGERNLAPDEIQSKAIAGTMLLPGDPCLGAPALPPCVPYRNFPVTDPVLGLRWEEEEVIKDGGDVPPRATVDQSGILRGLDPKDTVAEFADSCGHRHVTVSNRVCILVPRYAVVRTEVQPAGYEMVLGPGHARLPVPPLLVVAPLPPIMREQIEGPEIAKNRERPQVIQSPISPVIFEQWLSTGLLVAQAGPKVVIGTSAKKCCPPEKPLYLCKMADRQTANIGDVVTFSLRYINPGGAPITNIVVNDSLTGRLEYVPGSAKTDRDAVFTTQENEAGSVILRWQLSGELQPGQSGIITFQAKIR